MEKFSLFWLVVFTSLFNVGSNRFITCDSPQYLENGKTGEIVCQLEEDVFGIFWFIGTDIRNEEPIVTYKDSEKSGHGFLSGDYDVNWNGNLIIKEVSVLHDRNFTVMTTKTPLDTNPVYFTILVIVTVIPRYARPVIGQCGTANHCTVNRENIEELHCSVSSARPAIKLEWFVRSSEGDSYLPSNSTAVAANNSFTSRAKVDALPSSSSLLLVCKAVNVPHVLETVEAVILLQTFERYSSISFNKYVTERGANLRLMCNVNGSIFVMWRLKPYTGDPTYLYWGVLDHNNISYAYHSDYIITHDTTMTSPEAKHEQGGIYQCLAGDGNGYDIVLEYNVTVVAVPVPSYPVIDGCGVIGNCTLPIYQGDVLMCSVFGIWPEVQLKWEMDHDTSCISLPEQQVFVNSHENTYDVSLRSTVSIAPPCEKLMKLTCIITGSNSSFFDMLSTLTLFVLEDGSNNSSTSGRYFLLSLLGIPVVLIFAFILIFRRPKVNSTREQTRSNSEGTVDEKHPMIIRGHISPERKIEMLRVFISEVKRKYEYLSKTLRPVPFMIDHSFCVDDLFIEGQIETLRTSANVSHQKRWESIDSYQQIITNISKETNIVEGDPGYGKSTLSLQFVYEWSKKADSPISVIFDIVIFLRLRQMGNVKSLYQAIKYFILPKDSDIQENDIKEIMKDFKSVLFIFDGYDEYPDVSNMQNDISRIINREIYQEGSVIVTSRRTRFLSALKIHGGRFRLRGFDRPARNLYIRRMLSEGGNENCERIITKITENPVFEDMCETPLIFGLFVHIIDAGNDFSEVSSITGFFSFIISCFHSHLRNKQTDENVMAYEINEYSHKKLDELSFQSLFESANLNPWTRTFLVKSLGKAFYKQYIDSGILVEEEEITVDEYSVVKYQTTVRFHHKIFCEWYAGHHLTSKTTHKWLNTMIRKLDIKEFHNIYRFACGLNRKAATSIIDILKSLPGGLQLSILCLMEQENLADNVPESVEKITSQAVHIKQYDSLLLQRSTIQLLEIAAAMKIPIANVLVSGSFLGVDVDSRAIVLRQNQRLPALSTIEKLTISAIGKVLEADEIIDILIYMGQCPRLETLRLWYCFLPLSICNASGHMPEGKENVTVQWSPYLKDKTYQLSWETGRWKKMHDSLEEVSEQEHQEMCIDFQEYFKHIPKSSYVEEEEL